MSALKIKTAIHHTTPLTSASNIASIYINVQLLTFGGVLCIT